MNSSISSADATIHMKIVATALAAAIAVIWIGLATRISPDANSIATSTTSAASFVVTNESKKL